MKLFEAVIREYIGEREWTHSELVVARTLQSAEEKAHKYAKRFWASYEDNEPAKKNEDGQYEFAGGEIVEVMYVQETTKEKFCHEAFERALINCVSQQPKQVIQSSTEKKKTNGGIEIYTCPECGSNTVIKEVEEENAEHVPSHGFRAYDVRHNKCPKCNPAIKDK